MGTILLAWNPNRWYWDNIKEEAALLARQGFLNERWSCGTRKNIPLGTRFFLIRLGEEPKGIIASGFTKSLPLRDQHFVLPDKYAWYVDISFDVLSEHPIIARSRLAEPPFSGFHWNTQMSGIDIPDSIAGPLENEWLRLTHWVSHPLPEETSRLTKYYEGSMKQVNVNSYERNPQARLACINFYGTSCFICGFNFKVKYGDNANGYIQVHHLVPLSQLKKDYLIDPINDLRPVCPNCHAVIHLNNPPLSIEEMKTLVNGRLSS